MEHPDELIEQFSALAGIVLSDETVESVLRRVAIVAADTVPACDAVGVSVGERREEVTTVAADGLLAEQLDQLQYDTGEGPCLDAIDHGEPVRIDDLPHDDRWPTFAPAATEHGLRAGLSLPLAVQGQVLGALNLYSTREPFDPTSQRIANLFAAQAAVGLTNLQALHETRAAVEQLTQALESRDIIGQAKGIIMAREGCTPDRAFDILRRASQRTNMKLRDVAIHIVASAMQRAGEDNA